MGFEEVDDILGAQKSPEMDAWEPSGSRRRIDQGQEYLCFAGDADREIESFAGGCLCVVDVDERGASGGGAAGFGDAGAGAD